MTVKGKSKSFFKDLAARLGALEGESIPGRKKGAVYAVFQSSPAFIK
jgi:hypothetical protein